MNFTGERYVPTMGGEIEVEHLHRYAVAMEIAKGKRVLDMACGEGYGAALLSTVASKVVGVDISDDVVLQASATYKAHSNLSFVASNAISTSLESSQFDLVVSFETIEHLPEQDGLLQEIARLLKPDGVLIMSSPNRPVYAEGRQEPNKFHIRELDFHEFDQLLRLYFSSVDYYGQRMSMGTIVQHLEREPESYNAYSGNALEIFRCSVPIAKPTYFIALCSNVASVPAISSSIYLPRDFDLVERLVGFGRWAKRQDKEIEAKKAVIAALKEEVSKRESAIENLSRELAEQKTTYERRIHELFTMHQVARNELAYAEAQLALLKELILGKVGSSDSL